MPVYWRFYPAGTVVVKPRPQWSLAAAVMGAVDGFTRGLAVDMAPTRVNCISPGFVKTEVRLFTKRFCDSVIGSVFHLQILLPFSCGITSLRKLVRRCLTTQLSPFSSSMLRMRMKLQKRICLL